MTKESFKQVVDSSVPKDGKQANSDFIKPILYLTEFPAAQDDSESSDPRSDVPATPRNVVMSNDIGRVYFNGKLSPRFLDLFMIQEYISRVGDTPLADEVPATGTAPLTKEESNAGCMYFSDSGSITRVIGTNGSLAKLELPNSSEGKTYTTEIDTHPHTEVIGVKVVGAEAMGANSTSESGHILD